MSVQLTGARKRFRVSGALVALALGVAVFLLATQARSIWATGNEPQVAPAQDIVVPATNVGLANSGEVPCRPKYGCHDEGVREEGVPAVDAGLVTTGDIRPACRPKYGCGNDGGTAEDR